ncbi:MAG: DUF3488 and transglutaminase-like domain-containing protein [Thiohalomonadaceae bacterium]
MSIPLHGRLWLLAALAAVLLPQLFRLPVWLSLFCLALLGWRLALELRDWQLPGRGLRLLFTAIGLGSVLLTYRTLFGLEAGLALLSIMLSLKLLELRTPRDAMLTVFLGWFLVAGGFLLDQSILLGLYLLLTVFLLTAALIALNHPKGPRHKDYLRRAGLLLLQALPFMLLLFVLFPRLPGPLWGLPEDSQRGRTGLSDHMEPGSISELVDSDEVAFRVQFHGPVPPANQLYWRGPVLWTTDGRRWDPISHKAPPAWFFATPTLQTSVEPLRYTLTLEPHQQHIVLALEMAAEAPDKIKLTADYQLILPRKLSSRQRYDLSAYTSYQTGALNEFERRHALQLPQDLNPRTHTLAQEWINDPPAEIVRHALEYFRQQNFWYSRTPPLLGRQAIDEFLFVTQRGFCEHYAAAFVTLMRASGVPARIVTAYQGGELNPLADYMIVRQSHAHAWAEVWLAEQGWLRVDPTAVLPPERIEAEPDLQRFLSTDAPMFNTDIGRLMRNFHRLRYSWDMLNNAWNQWVLGYDHLQQKKLLQRLGLLKYGWQGLLVLTFSGLGLLMLWVLWGLHRRSSRHVDQVICLYARYGKKLRPLGLQQKPHETASEHALRIAAHRPDLARSSATISQLYNLLRYRQCNAKQLVQLRDAIRQFQP